MFFRITFYLYMHMKSSGILIYIRNSGIFYSVMLWLPLINSLTNIFSKYICSNVFSLNFFSFQGWEYQWCLCTALRVYINTSAWVLLIHLSTLYLLYIQVIHLFTLKIYSWMNLSMNVQVVKFGTFMSIECTFRSMEHKYECTCTHKYST